MGPIRDAGDIAHHASELVRIDPAFLPILAKAGEIPLRFQTPGYAGLASIICGQMVSRASAQAIWNRLEQLTGGVSAESLLAQPVEALRQAGLSGAKEASMRLLAQACMDGLSLETVALLPADQAIAQLTAVKGIGLWTSQVFLLFSAGHPDIFPHGDVALQAAAAHAFGMERLGDRQIRDFSTRWQPCRSIAARVLWAYYAREMKRDITPVAAKSQG